jgi:hypothetical protein
MVNPPYGMGALKLSAWVRGYEKLLFGFVKPSNPEFFLECC